MGIDGFVIPSLEIGDLDQSKTDVSEVKASKPPSLKAKKEENIYLGPHRAPPSQSKQQEPNSAGHEGTSGTSWENKLESLRELVDGGKGLYQGLAGPTLS
ncbi:hypothetical protein CFP56_016825 [Quercus suber]|uniref:Uncharacterized protein n=1 Tax=Quercus suber TaxID=58331 RepID=A0AAW0KN30_QUESU